MIAPGHDYGRFLREDRAQCLGLALWCDMLGYGRVALEWALRSNESHAMLDARGLA